MDAAAPACLSLEPLLGQGPHLLPRLAKPLQLQEVGASTSSFQRRGTHRPRIPSTTPLLTEPPRARDHSQVDLASNPHPPFSLYMAMDALGPSVSALDQAECLRMLGSAQPRMGSCKRLNPGRV